MEGVCSVCKKRSKYVHRSRKTGELICVNCHQQDSPSSERGLTEFEKKLGLRFKNPKLLDRACVHRSYLNEHRGVDLESNERLEFLGDSVLEMVVTEHLYRNYPHPEGKMTNWRASLVNIQMLSSIAQELEIEPNILMSRGEMISHDSKAWRNILGNAFEAILGALYLDSGYQACQEFLQRALLRKLEAIIANELYRDPKSTFQEQAQEKIGVTPYFQVLKQSGPDHEKRFRVGLYLDEMLYTTGEGSSTKEAQEAAVRTALEKFQHTSPQALLSNIARAANKASRNSFQSMAGKPFTRTFARCANCKKVKGVESFYLCSDCAQPHWFTPHST